MFDQWLPVIDNTQVGPSTYVIELRSREMAAAARPGQFLMIRAGSTMDPLLRRPFSICAVTPEDGLRVLYRVVGRGSQLLSSLARGDSIPVLGPLGRGFDLAARQRNPILIGGGIGIAPLVFLAQHLGETPFRFLQGFSSQADVVPSARLGLREEAVDLATDDGSAGYHGFVTDLLEAVCTKGPEAPEAIFACGPPAMLEKTAGLALERRISCQVSLEARMACGVGACQGCAVHAAPGNAQPYFHVCRDGPVFQAGAVDWGRIREPGITGKGSRMQGVE